MLRVTVLIFSLAILSIEVGIAESKGAGPSTLQPLVASSSLTIDSGSPWKKPELDNYPCDPTKPDACRKGTECVLHDAECSLSGRKCTIDAEYNVSGCLPGISCGKCRAITPADKNTITAGTCDYSDCETIHSRRDSCKTSTDCGACWNKKINRWEQAPCKMDADQPGVGVCDGCLGKAGLCDLNDPNSCMPDTYLKGLSTLVFYDECREDYRCKRPSPSPPKMCDYHVDVAGLVNQCCCSLDPYNVMSCNCTVFAHELHTLCVEQGIACKTLHIYCEDSAHAMNVVQINENECLLVEPQGGARNGIRGHFKCDKGPSRQQICAAMGKPDNCDCEVKILDAPVTPNTHDSGMCSRRAAETKSSQQENLSICEKCCFDTAAEKPDITGRDDWTSDCILACVKKYGANSDQFAATLSQNN